jgi:5-formyltetrahydrofolate cyclo-ligase
MESGSKSASKAKLRSDILERRSALLPNERQAYSDCICERLWEVFILPKLEHRLENKGKQIKLMGYMPIRNEVDILPLLKRCWSSDVLVLLPKVVKETRQMEIYYVHGQHELEAGAWGILEPKADPSNRWDLKNAKSKIDMVLVPGVAFDANMGRLGYGGGFYDRFINEMPAAPPLIAPAYEIQLVDEVPMERFDHRLDAIVTEKQVLSSKVS